MIEGVPLFPHDEQTDFNRTSTSTDAPPPCDFIRSVALTEPTCPHFAHLSSMVEPAISLRRRFEESITRFGEAGSVSFRRGFVGLIICLGIRYGGLFL